MKYGTSESSFGSKTGCDLPVDSHHLIALCSPRPLFISYGIPEEGDAKWLDQKGSYMAAVAAGKVYKLLGAKDLGVSNDYRKEEMPPMVRICWRVNWHGDSTVVVIPIGPILSILSLGRKPL